MFKVEVNMEGFDGLYDRIDILRDSLTERGIQEWFNLLLGDGEISIQSTLKNNIKDLVYNSPIEMIVGDQHRVQSSPNFYERTGRLAQATKAIRRGNKIHLFIDDNALGNRGNLYSMEEGTAKNLADTPYSLRVENDFIYENNYGLDVLRKGSKYMEKTYNDIKEDIFAGKMSPRNIMTPVLGVWKG